MRLSPMMGLMVEEVDEQVGQPLLDHRRAAGRAVTHRAREIRLAACGDISDDASILRLPRRAECREVIEVDRVKGWWFLTFA